VLRGPRELVVRHHRKHGRARGAPARSASELFEEALHGGQGGHRSNPQRDRKTLQLCRQVQRALSLAIGDASVDAVEPMGSAAQLLVRVGVPQAVSPAEVVARLNARAPQLRAEIASAISRKRVPTLTFVAVPAGAEVGHG
jgi:ribosome-binding factor A